MAAPWLVLGFLCFQPQVIRRYASPGGTVVLLVGAVVCVVAYRIMMQIGRLPTERRILTTPMLAEARHSAPVRQEAS